MTKKERFISWIKNYGYLVLLVAGFLTLLLVVTFASISSDNEPVKQPSQQEEVSGTTLTFGLPVMDASVYKGFSDTDLQWNETLKQYEAHMAVDFVAADQSSVLAVLDGTVSNVYSTYLDGTVVEVTHANNLKSVYASLDSETNFKVGDAVKKGDILGKISASANGELDGGAHLHFELLENDKRIDPSAYLNLEAK